MNSRQPERRSERIGSQQDDSSAEHPDAGTIRVLVLDDHEIVRRGVADLINSQDDMEVVAEAGSGPEALRLAASTAPHVAVLDVRLGGSTGIEVCRDIRTSHPDIACLMLTSFADDHAAVDAANAGAAGFVLKQIGSNDLVVAIRKVAGGAQLLDKTEVRLRMQRLKESDEGALQSLSPQEYRIFEFLGEGLSNKQIAAEMFLAEKTVKNYVSNLFTKLGISRRTEAAALAARIDEREKNRLA